MSDRGIILYRKMLAEQIEVVHSGGEPMNTVRDPDKNVMIELERWCSERDIQGGAIRHGLEITHKRSKDEVFDERHEIFEVPYGTARPRSL